MTTNDTSPDERPGERGILAPAARLDRWLDGVLVVLIVTCAIRYVGGHGLDASAAFVLGGAGLLVAAYAARPLVRHRAGGPTAWVVVVVALWTGLTLVAPSFAWTAVPIAFAVLQVLPFTYAAGVVVLMTVVVSVAWTRITDGFDLTVVVGPVGIALVTVMAFRALEQESRRRQRLLDDLTEAQADLVAAQRRSGALAERTRLSREIHDSVGQTLSSINLLLNAADQGWQRRPDEARQHVRTAAEASREALEEVRRVVRDLAPAELDDGTESFTSDGASALPVALRRVADRTGHGLDVSLRVHGTPTEVPPAVASAIVRTARGSLANVVEHAGASRVAITLTYLADEVRLDVRDDGRGFDGRAVRVRGDRGRGLSGIRDRADGLGGRTEVESGPGEGTTVSVAFPLEVAG